jgi:hypothetical protein
MVKSHSMIMFPWLNPIKNPIKHYENPLKSRENAIKIPLNTMKSHFKSHLNPMKHDEIEEKKAPSRGARTSRRHPTCSHRSPGSIGPLDHWTIHSLW